MAKERYIQICPRCRSTDIFMDNSNPLQPALGMPARYVCNKCKYNATIFPEVTTTKIKDFKGKKTKAAVIDTSYGDFMIRAMWKVVAPLAVLLGITLYFIQPVFGIVLTLAGLGMCYVTYIKKSKLKE